jgi:hypothetical protein
VSIHVPDSQWISVDDRLPEPGLIVLAIARHSFMISKHYTAYRTEPLDEGGMWFWRDSHDGRQTNWFTHWMPLPEPPEP